MDSTANVMSGKESVLCLTTVNILATHKLKLYFGGDLTSINEVLCWVKIACALGDLPSYTAAYNVHQICGVKMDNQNLYAIGTALALTKGENAMIRLIRRFPKNSQLRSAGVCLDMFQPKENVMSNSLLSNLIAFQSLPFSLRLFKRMYPPIDINRRDSEGRTALLLACRAGNTAASLLLLKHYPVDVSISDKNKEQPIHWLHAFDDDDVEVVGKALVGAGANLEACAEDSGLARYSGFNRCPTPLLRAILRGHAKAVQVLVMLGAKIEVRPGEDPNKFFSPISLAARLHDSQNLEHLLASIPGVDVRYLDSLFQQVILGVAPLERVTFYGPLYRAEAKKTLLVLIRYCPDFSLSELLRFATECGDLFWVQDLLELFDHVRTVRLDLQEALGMSIRLAHRAIFLLLMEKGALPLAPVGFSGFLVDPHEDEWSSGAVPMLGGANIRRTTSYWHLCPGAGNDARYFAEQIRSSPVRNLYHLQGLPPGSWRNYLNSVECDRRDQSGDTMLYHAIKNGELDLASYLLSIGAQKNPSSDFYSNPEEENITGRIISGASATLPAQLRFLLETRELPSFTVGGTSLLLIAAGSLGRFRAGEKQQLWTLLLSFFGKKEEILYRSTEGKTALQLLVESTDDIAVECVVNALHHAGGSIPADLSVISTARNMLISEAPERIGHSIVKRSIIDYRCRLGKIISLLLEVDDPEEGEYPGLVMEILRIVEDEYPIILQVFLNQGSTVETAATLQERTASYLKSFLPTFYDFRSDSERLLEAVGQLEAGFQTILNPYLQVTLTIGRTMTIGLQISICKPMIATAAVSDQKCNYKRWLESRHALYNRLQVLYEDSSRNTSFVAFPHDDIATLNRLGYGVDHSAGVMIPSPEHYLARDLERLRGDRQELDRVSKPRALSKQVELLKARRTEVSRYHLRIVHQELLLSVDVV